MPCILVMKIQKMSLNGLSETFTTRHFLVCPSTLSYITYVILTKKYIDFSLIGLIGKKTNRTYEGTRTLDHRLKRPALYRLSYAGWCQVQDSNPHLPIFKEGCDSDYTNLACLVNTWTHSSYISLFQNERKIEKI